MWRQLPRPFPITKLSRESNLPGREFYLSQLTEWDFCQTLNWHKKSHFSIKITRILTIYLEKKGNFNWKIKWFMPLHLGSFRNNMGCDLMQCNFSTLISLFSWFGYTYIYRSPTTSNSIDFCNLCTRFPPRWFVQTSKHPKQLFQKIFYCQEY